MCILTNEEQVMISNIMKEYNIPGLGIGYVENGKVSQTYTYGWADKDKLITLDTIYQVGSISKIITAWVIAQLMEKGKINFDDPVNKYLTKWHFKEGKYNSDNITIKLLLGHAAGVSVKGYEGRMPGETLATTVESLEGRNSTGEYLDIIYEPGERVSYSGGGYTLLQLLIEEVTGMSFAEYSKQAVLEPLEMLNSSFDVKDVDIHKLAVGHDELGRPLPNYLYTEKAAAGLYSTVEDLCKLMNASIEANTSAYESVISRTSLHTMQRRVLRSFPNCLAYDSFLLSKGKALVGRGINRGWQSMFTILPKSNNGIALVSNSHNNKELYSYIMLRWFEKLGYELSDYEISLMKFDRNTRERRSDCNESSKENQ